jgi:hypothetical protein
MQHVFLFGIGQHHIDIPLVRDNLDKADVMESLSETERKEFQLRLEAPFPINTIKHN